MDNRETSNIPKRSQYVFYWYPIDHVKLWNTLGEKGIANHLIVLMWNLCIGQKAEVQVEYGKTNWLQGWQKIERELYTPSSHTYHSYNLYAEYILTEAGLEEEEHDFKSEGRNINIHINKIKKKPAQCWWHYCDSWKCNGSASSNNKSWDTVKKGN